VEVILETRKVIQKDKPGDSGPNDPSEYFLYIAEDGQPDEDGLGTPPPPTSTIFNFSKYKIIIIIALGHTQEIKKLGREFCLAPKNTRTFFFIPFLFLLFYNNNNIFK